MNHIIGYNLRILYRFKNISLLRVFERYNITFDGGGGGIQFYITIARVTEKRDWERERKREKPRWKCGAINSAEINRNELIARLAGRNMRFRIARF